MNPADFERHHQLFLRVNRTFGAALLDAKLVSSEALEKANGRILELLRSSEWRQASLLSILLAGVEGLKENALIQYQVENHELGLIDLTHINIEKSIDPTVDLAACWATRTLPYERQEEFVMLATNFYMSQAARAYWEGKYKGLQLVWSAAPSGSLAEALERLEVKLAKKE
jgi:hypothetical protein